MTRPVPPPALSQWLIPSLAIFDHAPLSSNGPSCLAPSTQSPFPQRPVPSLVYIPFRPSLTSFMSRFHFRGPSRPFDKNSPLPPLSLISSIPPSPACSPQPTLPCNAPPPSLQTARLAAVPCHSPSSPMLASWCSAFLLPAPLLSCHFRCYPRLAPIPLSLSQLLVVSRQVNSSATPVSSSATTPARCIST